MTYSILPSSFKGFKTVIVSGIAILALCNGCIAPKRVTDYGSKIALRGQEVSDAALAAYDDLSKQAQIDKDQQDLIKILTSPDPAKANPNSPLPDFSKQLDVRIAAFKALRETYAQFQALSETNFGEQSQSAAQQLTTNFAAFKEVPQMPDSVSKAIPLIERQVTEAKQARDVVRLNSALRSLSDGYRLLWEEDEKTWKEYLDRVYSDFSSAFMGVDQGRFNVPQIAASSNDPYVDDVKFALYKINRRKESLQEQQLLLEKLRRVDQAFLKLNRAHVELTKQKPNWDDVAAQLGSIQTLLEKSK